MAQGTIENPIINSPFREPARHFRVVDGQVSGEVEERRRPSEFFVPVAKPKKASPQLALQFGGGVRQQPNEIVNEIRQAVGRWRTQGYPHTTSVTRELLAHWRAEDRERRLFFCQLEAAETAIYLVEAAEKSGDTKALNTIRAENARLNDALPRLAFKMATGSGKTLVMGMLIAWQALNKLANPYDKRFSTRFLIVTPGITIRDRLRVLLPNDPGTFFRTMDVVTAEQQLSTREVPTKTQLDPIVGEMNLLELPLHEHRMNTVTFAVAKRTMDTFFRDFDGNERPWLFPQLVDITRRWIDGYVSPYLGEGAYPQLLLLAEWSHAAAERI